MKASSVQTDALVIAVRTLKKRGKHVVREIPIPPTLAHVLKDSLFQLDRMVCDDTPLWSKRGYPIHRSTGYRWIKLIMSEAGIQGAMATPKGLRHGYGIHAVCSGVPETVLQRWMGHASLKTTSIYLNAVGAEQQAIASRMWQD